MRYSVCSGMPYSKTIQPSSVSSSVPPTIPDRYVLRGEIGRGGHSIVYRGHDTLLDRDVAIKVLREDAGSGELLLRFRQEMQIAAKLEHPHILHLYDSGVSETGPYIVMELASGKSLADRLVTERQLPVADVLEMAREIGSALQHAHDRGIVHRDIKPENILLGNGGALLADFGVAAWLGNKPDHARITSAGLTVGTLLYMSPEQLCAEPDIDARTDQYAFALVLYELLAGVRPHVASSFEALRALRMSGQHPSVTVHRPSAPASLADAIETALAPLSADRFPSVAEFLSAIGISRSSAFPVTSEQRRSGQYAHSVPDTGTLRGRRVLMPLLVGGVLAVSAMAAWQWRRWPVTATPIASDALLISLSPPGGAAELDPAEANNTSGTIGGNSGTVDPAERRINAMLRNEIRAWNGVRLVDGRAAAGAHVMKLTLSVNRLADSLRIRLVAEGSTPKPWGSIDQSIPVDSTPSASLVHQLMLDALTRWVTGGLPVQDAPGLSSLPARSVALLRAYAEGVVALRAARFTEAREHFADATRLDPQFTSAHYWAALAGAWSTPEWSEWREFAVGAQRGYATAKSDTLPIAALGAMAQRKFPEACERFEQHQTLNASDFFIALSAADCRRRDDAVVMSADGTAHFRTNHRITLEQYLRALRLAPTAALYEALLPIAIRLTYADGSTLRQGRSSTDSTQRFMALASIDHDTLALVPIPISSLSARAVPETWRAASRRGQLLADRITREALRTWPRSANVSLLRAAALELAGNVGPSGFANEADLALDNAERFDTSATIRARVSIMRTRLALRRGDVPQAVALARSTTASARTITDPAIRRSLAALAAFTGDSPRAESMLIPSEEYGSTLPRALADSLALFSLRAELGVCVGLKERQLRLVQLFRQQNSPADVEPQLKQWLPDAYLAAVPCLGVSLSEEFESPFPLQRVYRMLHAGNRNTARLLLDSLNKARRGAIGASITWDAIYREAWAYVEAGDTASAQRQLTEALDNLALMSVHTLDRPAQAAGVRRGLLLLRNITERRDTSTMMSRWLKAAASFDR